MSAIPRLLGRANLKLKRRPSYHTIFDATLGEIFIDAQLPECMELEEYSREELGEILYANVSDYVNKIPTPDKNFTKENIVRGAYHFLFDEKGDFMFNSMDLVWAQRSKTDRRKKTASQ
jgi:hypothetical protein